MNHNTTKKPRTMPWVKLWREERGEFALLPFTTRGLAAELLKLVDENGELRIGTTSTPVALLGRLLAGHRDERKMLPRMLRELESVKYLSIADGTLRITQWSKWQETCPRKPTHELPLNRPPEDLESASRVPRECLESAKRVGGAEAKLLKSLKSASVDIDIDKSREEENKHTCESGDSPACEIESKTTSENQTASSIADETKIVFEAWVSATNRDANRVRLDSNRRARISWALKNYGLEDSLRCISGYASSDFHKGDNDRNRPFNDITMWFRNATKFEAGLGLLASVPMATIYTKPLETKAQRAEGMLAFLDYIHGNGVVDADTFFADSTIARQAQEHVCNALLCHPPDARERIVSELRSQVSASLAAHRGAE